MKGCNMNIMTILANGLAKASVTGGAAILVLGLAFGASAQQPPPGYAYPQQAAPGYAAPGYPAPGYPQPYQQGYPQQAAPQGYPAPGSPAPLPPQQGYPQQAYQQPGYPQGYPVPPGTPGDVSDCVSRRLGHDFNNARDGHSGAGASTAMGLLGSLKQRFGGKDGGLDEGRLGGAIAGKFRESIGGDGGVMGFKSLQPSETGLATAGATMAGMLGGIDKLAQSNPKLAAALGDAMVACRNGR